MGAGLLARDMKQYQQVISAFHLTSVLDKWTELRQLIGQHRIASHDTILRTDHAHRSERYRARPSSHPSPPCSVLPRLWCSVSLRRADLFFVGPEYLKAVINDSGKLSQLDHAYLLAWIQMRADYSDNKRKILSSLNLKEAASTRAESDASANGGRRRRCTRQATTLHCSRDPLGIHCALHPLN
jgi:hypothetical protein